MDEENIIPDPPSFSEDDMRRCRETGDYKPILFEWYKFVGSLGFVVVEGDKGARDLIAARKGILELKGPVALPLK
jgi:hypothetical protein